LKRGGLTTGKETFPLCFSLTGRRRVGGRLDLGGQTDPNLDEGDGSGDAAAKLKLEGERPTFNDNDGEDTHRTKMDRTAIRRRTIGR